MILCAWLSTSHARPKKPVPDRLFFAANRIDRMKNKILASLGRGIGSFLGLPTLEQLGLPANFSPVASLPTGSLGGYPPEVSFTRPAPVAPIAQASAAAPLASRPVASRAVASPALHDMFRLYEEQLKLDFDLESKLALAATPDASRQIRAAFAQFRASKLRGKTMADIAKEPFALRPTGKTAPAPALEDDGTPVQTATPDDSENPPGVDGIISQLLDLVLELKKQLQITADDDAETVAALGLFGAGKKLSASRALMSVTQKMCTRPKLSPTARTARGFNSQPQVAALNSILSRRPGTSPAPAAVAVSTPPAAVASPSDRLAKITAIQAAMKAIDAEQRKSFSNARHSEHLKLKAQLQSLRLK